MKILHVVMFCSFSAVCVKTSAVLEVSGHVGGEVSIHCSVNLTEDSSSECSNMCFCKGACARENILIQTETKISAVTQQGRYSMEVSKGDGDVSVTMKRLKRADAGRYCCGVENTFDASYQEINLIVLDTSTVQPGSLPSTATLQSEVESASKGSSRSSTQSAPASLTVPTTKKANQQTVNLTDTTVVIIVSVSLALLVCALIPLVFYGHWRSNAEDQSRPEVNKGETDYGEENADGASTQQSMRLQSLEPDPESSAQEAAHYAAVYQALDPQTLD